MSRPYADRLDWFNQARFGLFIHWGLYSILGRGEWAMLLERIPKDEYARLADRFRPARFDALRWIRLGREAGMRYAVFTARHHDGFCLYDSRCSGFTSVRTAARRDFVSEYVTACREEGLRVGIYYSLLDWRFPAFYDVTGNNMSCREEMVAQAHAQVRELMTNYGRIDYLFYDGPNVLKHANDPTAWADYWRAAELNAMVRSIQPDIVINKRSGTDEDVDTPEQHVTASPEGRAWEANMTMGDYHGWGYLKHNPLMKPAGMLIRYLVRAASGGGNYLLNIGPKPDGTVRREETERLREMGRWMRRHGKTIYGSERVPPDWGNPLLGCVTARGATAYLHIFRWPGATATLVNIGNVIRSARMLATGRKIRLEATGPGRFVLSGLPEQPPDPHSSAIALELDGPPATI